MSSNGNMPMNGNSTSTIAWQVDGEAERKASEQAVTAKSEAVEQLYRVAERIRDEVRAGDVSLESIAHVDHIARDLELAAGALKMPTRDPAFPLPTTREIAVVSPATLIAACIGLIVGLVLGRR